MTHALNEMVGLPATTSPPEIARAADQYSEALYKRASGGDTNAQRDLLKLHCAYLTWAYTKPQS
jgi:hypothetical protein